MNNLLLVSGVILMLAAPVAADIPTFLLEWGSEGTGPGQFHSPHAVAVDNQGSVYVLDTGNARVQKFTEFGQFLGDWGSLGAGVGQLRDPEGIAFGNTAVYVGDTDNNRVQVFDASGNYLATLAGPGSLDGEVSAPKGVHVSASGEVYVCDAGNSRVQVFSSTGAFLRKWTVAGAWLWDIVVVGGTVYQTDLFNRRVRATDTAGNPQFSWGGAGTNGGGLFLFPLGIDADPGGTLYVADQANLVQMFDTAGSFLGQWGGSGSGPGQFNVPAGVAMSTSGDIYVVDINNHRVQKFGPAVVPVQETTWGNLKSAYRTLSPHGLHRHE